MMSKGEKSKLYTFWLYMRAGLAIGPIVLFNRPTSSLDHRKACYQTFRDHNDILQETFLGASVNIDPIAIYCTAERPVEMF